MASSTLANSPQSDRPFTGNLIDELTHTVKKVEKPKPPTPAPHGRNSDAAGNDPREKNACMPNVYRAWAYEQGI
jgi:hypothetical protein